MKANWFIALPCPVGSWYEEMLAAHPAPPGVRVFAAADLHLTVAFLGDVEASAAGRAFALSSLWPTGAVQASLGDVSPMGPPRRYSALSALLDEGRVSVEEGIAACATPMRAAAGLQAESRAAIAHMTVARPQRQSRADIRRAALDWALRLPLSGETVPLTEIALYTWAEDRSERLFRIVDRATL